MWTRLKQVALVAHHLQPVLDDLRAVLGLEVSFRDPFVRQFDLANAVLPIGHQFLEVVAPLEEGTTAGRYLERRNDDGGYMVITHCEDTSFADRQVDRLGLRTVLALSTGDGFECRQLHPRDTGGSFLETDHQPGAEDASGPWHPAGPDWQRAVRTDLVTGIRSVGVQSADPAAVARRWAEVLDLTVSASPTPAITLDEGAIHFLPSSDGRGDGLSSIELIVPDAGPALDAARCRGLPVGEQSFVVCGTRFILSTP
jgi:hypothetical protein